MNVSIANAKLRGKFCTKINKIFGCRDAYGCRIACPLNLWILTKMGMQEKNQTLGEALRLSIRESVDKGEGRRIIRDVMKNRHTEYPDISHEKIKKLCMQSYEEYLDKLFDKENRYEKK